MEVVGTVPAASALPPEVGERMMVPLPDAAV